MRTLARRVLSDDGSAGRGADSWLVESALFFKVRCLSAASSDFGRF